MERGNGGDVQDLGQAFLIPIPVRLGQSMSCPLEAGLFLRTVFLRIVFWGGLWMLCASAQRVSGADRVTSAPSFLQK